ncbi:MAG: YidC/Oxa1 family membrane protein insertase [Defluviitaleaceae bacterium]|nr:YidC/Oxa1 family membrane protein insertase [Defluviitaleaceae bacterium]
MFDFSTAILAARLVESPPGAIMGPIARAFGFLVNFIFDLVYRIGPTNSLGIAIILMTIIFRFLILPLGLKSQKSMIKMRELQPELKKIKDKYGNSKDPEIMKKSQQEQSALLSKHGANPLSGCLPMLIQFPLFIGLNIVMRQASLYITRLREMYEYLAEQLLLIPGLVNPAGEPPGLIQNLAEGRITGYDRIVPEAWAENLNAVSNWLQHRGLWYTGTEQDVRAAIDYIGNDVIIMGWPDHLARVINRFTPTDWELVYANITDPAQLEYVQHLISNLVRIETFFGISVVEPSGWGLPGILIPIITGISMFVSSWLMQQRTFDPNADERAVLTQKMMLFVMPVMMAFFTVGLVAAVGVFWITGQLFQIIQDIILLKKSGTPIRMPFAKPPEAVVDVVPAKKRK